MQQEVHLCKADEILFGGSAGPGKSLCLLMDPIQTQMVTEHRRWIESARRKLSIGWAIHFRREFPRLEQTIARSHRIFRALDSDARYDEQKHTWTFSCGYKLQFGHMKLDQDRFNYISNEYTHIAWDEVSEFTEEQYQFVNTRLRTADHELQKKLRVVCASNPSGNWVRKYFVDPAPKGRTLLEKDIKLSTGATITRSRIYIPAKLVDNPDPEFRATYEANLRDKPKHIQRALLESDWYAVAGAFFAEVFNSEVHVIEPIKIPTGHLKFRSMDWGIKNWGTVGWYAVNTDGDMTKYREFNFRRMDAAEVAEEIQRIEINAGEWDENKKMSRLTGPADTQIWEVRGTVGPTIAEEMAIRGVNWQKCTKNKRAAVEQLWHRLSDRGEDGNGQPGIRFFRSCRRTIETLPAIGTSENDAELPADGGDDHWLDEVLYACMYRAGAAKQDELSHSRQYYDELGEFRKQHRRMNRGKYGYGF